MISTYSLHKFKNVERPGFKVRTYSKFKHGCIVSAEEMGKELSTAFFKSNITLLRQNEKQIVVYPSAYYFIPSAANYLAEFFIKDLNRRLVKMGKKPAVLSKIMRELTYHSDYGKMNSREREQFISRDSFFIDKEYLENKLSIHIDDVKITGAHEKTIDKLISGVNVEAMYLYYAEDLTANPENEDYLNNHSVKTFKKLLSIINSKNAFYNVRNMRKVLLSNEEDFNSFLEQTKTKRLEEFYDLCIGNQYNKVKEYSEKVHLLKTKLNF